MSFSLNNSDIILNTIIFFLVFFLLQIFFYRFLKINLNKISFIFSITFISIITSIYFNSFYVFANLIIINLIVFCFYIIMSGIVNLGPALTIVDLIANKKIYNKKKLKNAFLKSKSGNAIEKRLKININSNFIKTVKNGFVLEKKAEKIIIFFNIIKKIYKLKSDA